MLARCPTCRNTFSTERAGRQDCPVCGKPLVVPEPVQAAVPPAASGEAPPESAPGTPWEHREELGLFPAWLQTMQLALFEPTKLFRMARIDRGSAHLGFAVLTTSVFWAIGQILDRAFFAGQREQLRKLLGSMANNPDLAPMLKRMIDTGDRAGWGWVLALTLFTPVFSWVLLYLNTIVTHGVALVIGQSKRGFAATFTACAYACAPLVLLAVPACGSIIALIWLVILCGIGMKETHRISSGGAAATVLAPYALFCCLSMAAGVVMALAFRNAMGPQ